MANPIGNPYDITNNSDNILSGNQRARVGGSGFTVFVWDQSPILYARQIGHQAPQPVGPGTVPIHPMDTPYPVELITPQAISMGTITLELYELYGSHVWERLSTFAGTPRSGDGHGPVDLAGIFQNIALAGDPVRVYKYIRPPKRAKGKVGKPFTDTYTEEFHNIVVSQLQDSEAIEVGTMEVLKQMTVNYTHKTVGGRNQLLKGAGNLGVNTADAADLSGFNRYR